MPLYLGIKFKWDPSLGGIKGPTCEYRPGGIKVLEGTRKWAPSLPFPLYLDP